MDNLPIPFTQDANGLHFRIPARCRQPVATIVRLIYNDDFDNEDWDVL